MNQATVLTVGMIAVSAALCVPNAQVPRTEFRVAVPWAGYPRPVLAGYSDHTINALVKVTFSGNASVQPNTVLTLPIKSVADAEGQEAIVERLHAIRSLRDGWLGDRSAAPDGHLLDWLDQHAELIAASSNTISIIPLGDGAVSLEWKANAVEYAVELQPNNHMIFVADDTRTDEVNEEEAVLDPNSFADFISRGTFV